MTNKFDTILEASEILKIIDGGATAFQTPGTGPAQYGFPNVQINQEENKILNPKEMYKPEVKFDMEEPINDIEPSDAHKLFIDNLLKSMQYMQKAEIAYHFQRMLKICLEKNPEILKSLLIYMKEEIEEDK